MRQALERARQRHRTIDAALADAAQRDRERRAARLGRLLAGRSLPCPACGYDLRGLRTDVCPECGADLLSALVPAPPSLRDELLRPPSLAAGLNLLVGAAGLGLLAFTPAFQAAPAQPATILAALGVATPVAVVCTWWARAMFGMDRRDDEALWLLTSAGIAASLVGAAWLLA